MIFDVSSCLSKKMSQRDRYELEKEFSMDDIWMALSESDSQKASGPDGLNAGWLKHLWPLLRNKISLFFEKFHSNGEIPQGSNSSFIALIALIPNKKNLVDVGDFRPISLINSSFKLLLKVLANRLKIRLDKLVAEEQTSFISGRNISDGILMANEIIHSMRIRDKDVIIPKLDFAKAYDSVNWESLAHVLSCLNFWSKWVE